MLHPLDKQRPELADAFIALIGLALAREADQLAQTMLDSVRRMRPESPRIEAFDGWLSLRQGDIAAAGRHLCSAVEALGDEAGTARTLLAMVLCAQGDPRWLPHAQAIIADGQDENSVTLLKAMMNDAGIPLPQPIQPPVAEMHTNPMEQESSSKRPPAMYLRA